MKFGELLKAIRKEYGLTQLQFSEIVEVSRSQIANIERDNSDPAFYWISFISERLKLVLYYEPGHGWDFEKLVV